MLKRLAGIAVAITMGLAIAGLAAKIEAETPRAGATVIAAEL